MKNKDFNPFISGNKVIVDLDAKIDILVYDDIYIVSKNSKPLYFFDESANAVAFALIIYFDCIDCSFMTTDLVSFCRYFSNIDDLLSIVFFRQLRDSEDNKNE